MLQICARKVNCTSRNKRISISDINYLKCRSWSYFYPHRPTALPALTAIHPKVPNTYSSFARFPNCLIVFPFAMRSSTAGALLLVVVAGTIAVPLGAKAITLPVLLSLLCVAFEEEEDMTAEGKASPAVFPSCSIVIPPDKGYACATRVVFRAWNTGFVAWLSSAVEKGDCL